MRGGEEVVGGEVERPMRQRRRRREAEVDDGYSASSTSGDGDGGGSSGSFGCDSPLAGFVRAGGSPGPDLEPDGLATSSNASAASTEPHEEEEEVLDGVKEEEWVELQEPAKNLASRAIRECQNQRYRSEAVLFHGRKGRKQRPASLDFGSPGVDGTTLSPGFLVGGVGVMNKGLVVSSHIRSDVFPSPGTPNYRRHGAAVVGYQKGWSSERVPLPSNSNRRYPGSGMAFPFNNGRTLPSKWEDAERWIFSPNSGDAVGRTSFPQARRPKSKSGPLGPPGRIGGPYSSVSSSVSLLDGGRVGHLTANSPFLAGVLIPEHVCGGNNNIGRDVGGVASEDSSNGRGGRSCLANGGPRAIQSTRVRRRLDIAIESSPSLPSSRESMQDEQVEITEESATVISPVVLKKDVATQTSPELSRSSSPNVRPSFSRSLSTQQVKELESCFAKLEIRDVQMDDRVTLTRWSKKHVTRGSDKNSTNIIEWKKKTLESKSSSWELTGTAKCISKFEGEEAKITAWENLQKAKAEAAIQKLVMKLEKKRSSSLDKIFNTLRYAQRKAQEMRSAATANQDQHISGTAKKTSHLNKNAQISSLSGCFTCHAF